MSYTLLHVITYNGTSNNMTESITFKLPPELRAALESEASRDGRSISDYIRRHFTAHLQPRVVQTAKKQGRSSK